MTPTDQDIFNLKNGNLSPIEFDEKYGAGKHQIYVANQIAEEEIPAEPQGESRITELPEQIMGGIVDATQEAVDAFAGLGNIADQKLSLRDLSATIREKALEKGINIPIITIDDGKFSVRSGQEAIDYIWNKFTKSFIADSSQALILEIEKIRKGLNHKILYEVDADFYKNLLKKIQQVKPKTPHYSWEYEIAFVQKYLAD